MKKHTRLIIVLCLLAGFLAVSLPASVSGYFKSPYLVIAAYDDNKYSPAVAYNSLHDEYLVVWETDTSYGYHKIYGRRISGNGTLLDSFIISSPTSTSATFNCFNPAVVYDSINDQYLVVWAYDTLGDGSDWDVFGRYLPWSGPDPAKAEFAIATDRISEYKPKVAFNTVNGDTLLIWLEDGTPDHPVAGTLIHNNGTYTLLDIASGGGNVRDFPDVTFNSGLNQYLVAWDVFNSGTGLDVHAVRIDSLGAKVPPGEITIANSIKNEQHASVAACATANQFLVTYQQTRDGASDDDIWGNFLSGNGTLGAQFFVAGTTAPQGWPDATCNYTGDEYFIAWHDMYASPQFRYGIWGKWLRPDGSTNADFEIVAPSTYRDRLYPAIASGRAKTLVVWVHGRENPNYQDIWGSLVCPNVIFLPLLQK